MHAATVLCSVLGQTGAWVYTSQGFFIYVASVRQKLTASEDILSQTSVA